MKMVLNTVKPSLLGFVNSCLRFGTVPAVFEHAVVRPLLKKPNLDPTVLSNFRPVSHLSFLSRVLKFLFNYNLFWKTTISVFKSHHSTESALLKVHNDIAMSVDAKCPVVLVLLDLTVAFDTVDQSVLLSRLKNFVGIYGTALK